MHWIVQNNLLAAQDLTNLCDTLERFNIPHTQVKVIPFYHVLEPDINLENTPVFVIGSTGLVALLNKKDGFRVILKII